MRIGIDIRSLSGSPITGVGTYLQGVLSGLATGAIGSSMEHEYVLWHTGMTPVVLSGDKRIVLHRRIPNKVLSALWSITHRPHFATLFPRIDFTWLPNLAVYPFRHSVPYGVTVHDLSFLHYPGWFSLKRRLWHRLVQVRGLLSQAQIIITVSESTRDSIKQFFPELAQRTMHVIPPAISLVEENPDALRDVPDEYIVYVGTLEPRKNVDAIIMAFKQIARAHPRLQLVLVGAFGWSVSSLVHTMRHEPRIKWLRYLSQTDKEQVYAKARVCIWPSFFEGYGFPPVEALARGVPVIVSYRTSLPQVLRDHAVYVNPYNAGELAKVLDEVLTAPQVPMVLGHLPEHIRKRTWVDVAHEYNQVFSEINAHRN